MLVQTNAYDVQSLVVLTSPGFLQKLQGYWHDTTNDRWVQVHDAIALPANGAVPLVSLRIQADFAFSWNFDPSSLGLSTGLVVAVSETQATLTIVTGASGSRADFQVSTEGIVEPIQGPVTTVSPVSDGRKIVPWVEATGAAGRVRLLNATVINTSGSTMYIMLFPTSAPVNGDYPLWAVALATGGTLTLNYGPEGLLVYGAKAGGVGYDSGNHACALVASTTAPTLTLPSATPGIAWTAQYITLPA